MRRGVVALGLVLVLAVALPARAADDTPDGALLAQSCALCHGIDGDAPAPMPALAGIEPASLEAAMKAFRDETVPEATVMPAIARGYDDAQIAALADFFALVMVGPEP